jgi:hypothetical protein
MVPHPPQRPLGGGAPDSGLFPQPGHRVGRRSGQPAAQQRFHDDDSDAPGRGVPESLQPGLIMLIQVIELDLAEIPVVGADNILEDLR